MRVIRVHKTDLAIYEFKHVTKIEYNERTEQYKITYTSGEQSEVSEFGSDKYFVQILVM